MFSVCVVCAVESGRQTARRADADHAADGDAEWNANANRPPGRRIGRGDGTNAERAAPAGNGPPAIRSHASSDPSGHTRCAVRRRTITTILSKSD